MKFIENLTRDELVKLTPEEEDLYLQRELAKRGIGNIEEPKLNLEKLPDPDRMYYKINGCDYYFERLSDAEKVLDSLKKTKGIVRELYSNWDGGTKYEGGDYQIKKPEEEFSLKEVKFYSENLYVSTRVIIDSNAKKKKAYDELVKVYRDNQEAVQTATSYVRDIIDNAISEYNEEKKYISEYQRMLKLSEGNETIARNFFSNTYFSLSEAEVNNIISIATQAKAEAQTETETH